MRTMCESSPDVVELDVRNPRSRRGRWWIAVVVAVVAATVGSWLLVAGDEDDRVGSAVATDDAVELSGAVVQVGSEMLPIVQTGGEGPAGVGDSSGPSFQMEPSSFAGLEPPRVIPVESVGAVFYAAIEDRLTIDRERGVDEGESFGVPVIRSVDLASGTDELVARGVLTFAVRSDGALAMAVGRTPKVINGEPYVRDVVVRLPSGEESTWSPRPAGWEVLAWASGSLIVREHVSEEGGGYQSLYLLNGRGVTELPGEYLVAVSTDSGHAVLSRGGQLAELPADDPVLYLVDLEKRATVQVLTAAEVKAAGVRNLNPGSGDWRLNSVVVPADPVPLMLGASTEKFSVTGTVPVSVTSDTYGAKQIAFVGGDGLVIVLTESPIAGSKFGDRTATVHACTQGSCNQLLDWDSGDGSTVSIGMNPSRGGGA